MQHRNHGHNVPNFAIADHLQYLLKREDGDLQKLSFIRYGPDLDQISTNVQMRKLLHHRLAGEKGANVLQILGIVPNLLFSASPGSQNLSLR